MSSFDIYKNQVGGKGKRVEGDVTHKKLKLCKKKL